MNKDFDEGDSESNISNRVLIFIIDAPDILEAQERDEFQNFPQSYPQLFPF